MRAIVINAPGGLDNLQLTELPTPSPKPNEVLVQWHACSLNYHDLHVVTRQTDAKEKLIPMTDGAGVILSVGEHVTRWQQGDRVISTFYPNWIEGDATTEKVSAMPGDTFHGFAVEKSCVNTTSLTRMPDNYSYAQASTLPCAALTAWRALMVEGGLQAGDTVLIEGSGGMSVFALQFAKAAGAYVYATSSSDEKLARLKQLGADEIINYKTDPDWGKTINKLSDGGVKHVLDVGGGATLKQSIAAARCGGIVYLIGILADVKAEVVLPILFGKQLRLQGLAVGSAEMQKSMVNAININHIHPVIDRTFKLEELADAFRYQQSGSHFGKIVIEF